MYTTYQVYSVDVRWLGEESGLFNVSIPRWRFEIQTLNRTNHELALEITIHAHSGLHSYHTM